MPSLTKEIAIAFGFKQQTTITTPLVAADMFRLRQTNAAIPQPEFIRENDAADIGTDIYATDTFKSHIKDVIPFDARLSSENFALVTAFGMGATTKTAAGAGWKYTSIAPVIATLIANDLDLPTTTVAAAIRQGGSPVTDKALIGVGMEEFGISLKFSPGRDNATLTSQWMGTGNYVSPSTITIPASTVEHSLNAGGATVLSILGVDYIANKRFLSLEMNFKNNIREALMFHPGSGLVGGFQIGDRMWRGVPAITCKTVVLAAAGGAEEAALIAGTEGVLTFTIEGAVIGGGPDKHTAKVTLHRCQFQASPIGDQDGLVTYQVEVTPLLHTTNGYATFEAITTQNNILAVA